MNPLSPQADAPACRPAIGAGRLPLALPALMGLIALPFVSSPPVTASDHSDVPVVADLVRQDANLTDLHAFVVGTNLVVSLCSNPAIPRNATGYLFPADVTFEVHIDNDSAVDPFDPLRMGGTILDPARVQEDVLVRIRFDDEGEPQVQVQTRGSRGTPASVTRLFAGLRDDPFIRGPRQGRNIAALVLEIPLLAVAPSQGTLLIWGTSKVEEADGPHQDLAGRSLRSMMPENSAMNTMLVRQQSRQMGVPPDVMIFDTTRPAAYPNGRALTDDVVDLVGDPRVLANDAPFPSQNDRPFLNEFPYLAEPHPAQ